MERPSTYHVGRGLTLLLLIFANAPAQFQTGVPLWYRGIVAQGLSSVALLLTLVIVFSCLAVVEDMSTIGSQRLPSEKPTRECMPEASRSEPLRSRGGEEKECEMTSLSSRHFRAEPG